MFFQVVVSGPSVYGVAKALTASTTFEITRVFNRTHHSTLSKRCGHDGGILLGLPKVGLWGEANRLEDSQEKAVCEIPNRRLVC